MKGQPTQVIVLGVANTGKTHYGVQLYGRLRQPGGQMSLASPPQDLTIFEEAFLRLEQGFLARHTETDTYKVVHLDLVNQRHKHLNIVWPDYGGEQLLSLLSMHRVPQEWEIRLKESECWILFLRPLILTRHTDILDSGANLSAQAENSPRDVTQWDGNAELVELLQILLYVSGHSVVTPLSKPKCSIS